MQQLKKPIVYRKFKGKNNIDDAHRISKEFLEEATDVDIDKTGALSMRPGFTPDLTGSYRSIWSDSSTILAIKNGDLMRIIPGSPYTEVVLQTGVGDFDMVYEKIGSKIYFTNEVVIGYVEDNQAYSLPIPATTFKKALPAGHLMALYKGVLYMAIDNLILYSDAFAYNRYDERNDPFQFAGKLTLMKPVGDGMFVSDGKTTMLLLGSGPKKFTFDTVANYGAIMGTAASEKSVIIAGRYHRDVVMWNSEKGVCIGGNEGYFKNLTELRYSMPNATKGAGIIKKGTINQYMSITRN